MSRDITFYIVDIFIAIDKLKRYSKPYVTSDELLYSELAWDACIRELEVIGEATKHLLNNELIDSSYRRVVDFRNQISHGYFGINEDIVWDVIQNKIPQYENDLLDMIKTKEFNLKDTIKAFYKDNLSKESVEYLKYLEGIVWKIRSLLKS